MHKASQCCHLTDENEQRCEHDFRSEISMASLFTGEGRSHVESLAYVGTRKGDLSEAPLGLISPLV